MAVNGQHTLNFILFFFAVQEIEPKPSSMLNMPSPMIYTLDSNFNIASTKQISQRNVFLLILKLLRNQWFFYLEKKLYSYLYKYII